MEVAYDQPKVGCEIGWGYFILFAIIFPIVAAFIPFVNVLYGIILFFFGVYYIFFIAKKIFRQQWYHIEANKGIIWILIIAAILFMIFTALVAMWFGMWVQDYFPKGKIEVDI